MLFRMRKVLALLLMAGSAVGIAAGLTGWWYLDSGISGLWVTVAALVAGTVGLASGVWWGRLIPLAWSAAVAVVTATAAIVRDDLFAGAFLVGAIVLGACVSGPKMFAAYEGKAPPPLDWTMPGMRFVRAALVANLYGFLGGAAVAGSVFAPRFGRTLDAGLPQMSLFLACLVTSVVMLAGLVLLARQRTVGLFLLAATAVAMPLILSAQEHGLTTYVARMFLLFFGPGILCGWLALGRFVPGMVRLLRR